MKATPESLRVLKVQIARARTASGRTNREIGERADVDPSQVSRICTGEFKRISQNVVQICMTLGVDVRQLSGIDQAPPFGELPWRRLEGSLQRLWDRTPEGLDQIAKLLDLVASLREPGGSKDRG